MRLVIILCFRAEKGLIIRVAKNSLFTVTRKSSFFVTLFKIFIFFSLLAFATAYLKVKEDIHMRTFSGKRSTLALAIAGVTALTGWVAVPQASSMIQR